MADPKHVESGRDGSARAGQPIYLRGGVAEQCQWYSQGLEPIGLQSLSANLNQSP